MPGTILLSAEQYMTDKLHTDKGDVVVTATEPTNLMFDVWAVAKDGQQEPTPETQVSNAMGAKAATALADEMARPTHGHVVQQNLEGTEVSPDPLAMILKGFDELLLLVRTVGHRTGGGVKEAIRADIETALLQDRQRLAEIIMPTV